MGSHDIPDFEELIRTVAQALERHALPYMVIGGQALLIHGEPRLTEDIDLTLGVGPDGVDDVLAACASAHLEPLPDDPRAFARRTYVLPVIEPRTRVRVDFIFSTLPYERQAIQRALQVPIGTTRVVFATAEDLILHKLFAGRPRDLEDARSVVARNSDSLDWGYLEHWAHEFSVVEGRENLPEIVRQLRTFG